jgi:hypothetical protein
MQAEAVTADFRAVVVSAGIPLLAMPSVVCVQVAASRRARRHEVPYVRHSAPAIHILAIRTLAIAPARDSVSALTDMAPVTARGTIVTPMAAVGVMDILT